MHELIENIDIGGPTLIRAAAKNYQDVAVVASPDDYAAILQELHESKGELSEPTLWRLAQKAFALTAAYDRAISTRLARVGAEEEHGLPAFLDIRAPRALGSALRRESASVQRHSILTGEVESLAPSSCRARSFLQQPGGSGRRLATDPGIPSACIRHHQAHQSVWMRRRSNAGRELPAGLRSRSNFGVRRRPRIQPHPRRGNCARSLEDLH